MVLFLILYLFAEEKLKIEGEKMEIVLHGKERGCRFSEGVSISLPGRLLIRGREGYYFPTSSFFILKGGVKIESEEGILKGDSCIYNLSTEESELFKNVEIDLESLSIWTNHLKLNLRGKTCQSEEANLIPEGKNLELRAFNWFYNMKERRGEGSEPVILLKDGETTVKAKGLVYLQPSSELFLLPPVEINQKERRILCDTLIYFISGDSGIGRGNLYLISERERVKGKTFYFWTEKGELKRMKVREEVSVSYETDKERIEISAGEFCLTMANGEIEEVLVAEITSGRLVRK
uniref:Organic solvent tolerance-like N-terminal domain-containing protein n=1 Tax=candidate division WOR-3 bacterium TaxID=2052148 RepID=A0A7C3UZ82_UNCW3